MTAVPDSSLLSRQSRLARNGPNLLARDDTTAHRTVNAEGNAPCVIVCDHASNAVPKRLDRLGLPDSRLDHHIAYDIGAAGVAARLSERIDAPAILSGHSRLVIDMNRPVDDFTSIREISDGVVIPGNRSLPESDCQARIRALHFAYHEEIARVIAAKRRQSGAPAVISVHSCTDRMRGETRPWHIGVLYNRDDRLAGSMIRLLRAQNPALTIGDNQPYSGMDPYGYTIETHALPAGLPNVLFEVRQDLIPDPAGQGQYAEILANALSIALYEPGQLSLFAGSAT